MKKLIKLLIIVITLSSCGRETFSPAQNKSIVKSIEYRFNSLCWYYGDGNDLGIDAFSARDFIICDSCGKFKIGDTLKLTK